MIFRRYFIACGGITGSVSICKITKFFQTSKITI